jgi:hypothetical protein
MAAKITKGCATLATCTAFMSPMNAFAADDTGTSFKVDINVPYLVELVKTKEERTNTFDRVSFLAESIKNLFGPAVAVQLPTDIKGVVKDALSGGASVTINELDVGIKVVGSEKGALTIQLSTICCRRFHSLAYQQLLALSMQWGMLSRVLHRPSSMLFSQTSKRVLSGSVPSLVARFVPVRGQYRHPQGYYSVGCFRRWIAWLGHRLC